MKRIFLVTALLVFSICNLPAQTKKEKIKELFQLMHTDSMMTSILDNMTMIQNKAFTKAFTSNSKRDSLYRSFVKEETMAMVKEMNDKFVVEAYDKYFTTEEIQKYIDFYRSPAGQKMVNLMPQIHKDLMTQMATEYMTGLQAKFKKKLEELDKY